MLEQRCLASSKASEALLNFLHPLDGLSRNESVGHDVLSGTQFTCFTNTKVQILTLKLQDDAASALPLLPDKDPSGYVAAVAGHTVCHTVLHSRRKSHTPLSRGAYKPVADDDKHWM
jgi:hypothetical protein